MRQVKRHLISPCASQHGFTLLELMIVATIVAIVAAMLLVRLRDFQEQAEKAAMMQVVGNIRSGLHLKLADVIVKGEVNQIPRLLEINPMDVLADKPDNYRGEVYGVTTQSVVSGNWYFDLRDRNLIYFVNNDAHLQDAAHGEGKPKEIRYRLKLVKAAIRVTGKSGPDTEIEGVTLEEVVPYKWF